MLTQSDDILFHIHAQEEADMATREAAKKVKESISRTRITSTLDEVEFTYHAPDAKRVCMAGKFNDWNTKSLPMKKG